MKYPVTLQIPVNVADGSIWLYEKKVELRTPPHAGLLLVGYSPNVFGPGRMADNVIKTVVDRADGEVCCGIHGLRDGSRSAEEMDQILVPQGFQRRELLKKSPLEPTPGSEDLRDLFKPEI